MTEKRKCPCQSELDFMACCQPYLLGVAVPHHPEALMRSRYTAYTLGNIDYILQTMRGAALQGFDFDAAKTWATAMTWQGLTVLASAMHPSDPDRGTVEFIARYHNAHDNTRHLLHEISEFKREMGRWYYMGGVRGKINRNDICPICTSGKKFKKCCGQFDD